MTAFELLRDLLALIGILCLLMRLLGRNTLKMLGGEDGPIRVKGGTVTILSDNDWDRDPHTEDGDDEHQYADQFKRWNVKAWKSEVAYELSKKKPQFEQDGKKVILEVEGGTTLVFRTNGLPRVKAPRGQLSVRDKMLYDGDSSHWPKRVIVINDGEEKPFSFDPEVGYMILKPLKK